MTAERDETLSSGADRARCTRPRRRLSATTLTTLTQSAADDDTALDLDFSLEQAALTWSHRLGSDDAFDAPGVMRFGSVKVQQSIVERVVKAAQTTEMDPALLMAIADKEFEFLLHREGADVFRQRALPIRREDLA